jgi:hypothetical protein
MCIIFIARTNYIQRDYNDVRFVQDQHGKLDFYGAISLKQQSTDRHVAQLGYICSFSLIMCT